MSCVRRVCFQDKASQRWIGISSFLEGQMAVHLNLRVNHTTIIETIIQTFCGTEYYPVGKYLFKVSKITLEQRPDGRCSNVILLTLNRYLFTG